MSGPLNKKVGLDTYYADYDSEFPDKEHWMDAIREVRSLSKLIVGGDLTGWTTKTEFYSLFLAVGELVYADEFPTTKQKIKKASERLSEFRHQIPRAKRKGSNSQLPDYVVVYADAVARASTDISRRQLRIAIISAIISNQDPPSSIEEIA